MLYVMLCYVMLCYVMLCYVMLCYVMLCYSHTAGQKFGAVGSTGVKCGGQNLDDFLATINELSSFSGIPQTLHFGNHNRKDATLIG